MQEGSLLSKLLSESEMGKTTIENSAMGKRGKFTQGQLWPGRWGGDSRVVYVGGALFWEVTLPLILSLAGHSESITRLSYLLQSELTIHF